MLSIQAFGRRAGCLIIYYVQNFHVLAEIICMYVNSVARAQMETTEMSSYTVNRFLFRNRDKWEEFASERNNFFPLRAVPCGM